MQRQWYSSKNGGASHVRAQNVKKNSDFFAHCFWCAINMNAKWNFKWNGKTPPHELAKVKREMEIIDGFGRTPTMFLFNSCSYFTLYQAMVSHSHSHFEAIISWECACVCELEHIELEQRSNSISFRVWHCLLENFLYASSIFVLISLRILPVCWLSACLSLLIFYFIRSILSAFFPCSVGVVFYVSLALRCSMLQGELSACCNRCWHEWCCHCFSRWSCHCTLNKYHLHRKYIKHYHHHILIHTTFRSIISIVRCIQRRRRRKHKTTKPKSVFHIKQSLNIYNESTIQPTIKMECKIQWNETIYLLLRLLLFFVLVVQEQSLHISVA